MKSYGQNKIREALKKTEKLVTSAKMEGGGSGQNYDLRFCDEGLKLLCETCDLKQLDLSETRVTDESVHQLLEMESLQVQMSHKL